MNVVQMPAPVVALQERWMSVGRKKVFESGQASLRRVLCFPVLHSVVFSCSNPGAGMEGSIRVERHSYLLNLYLRGTLLRCDISTRDLIWHFSLRFGVQVSKEMQAKEGRNRLRLIRFSIGLALFGWIGLRVGAPRYTSTREILDVWMQEEGLTKFGKAREATYVWLSWLAASV